MYNQEKAHEIYKRLLEEDPEFDHKLVMDWKHKMPAEFAKRMYEHEYGNHIFCEELYEEAVSHLTNRNNTKGAHWSLSTIKSKSNIDFDEVEYTCYDYAYVVNMLYSDYGDVFSEPTYYLRMAKNYLTDNDYFGNPSERAYKNACERIEYFSHK